MSSKIQFYGLTIFTINFSSMLSIKLGTYFWVACHAQFFKELKDL